MCACICGKVYGRSFLCTCKDWTHGDGEMMVKYMYVYIYRLNRMLGHRNEFVHCDWVLCWNTLISTSRNVVFAKPLREYLVDDVRRRDSFIRSQRRDGSQREWEPKSLMSAHTSYNYERHTYLAKGEQHSTCVPSRICNELRRTFIRAALIPYKIYTVHHPQTAQPSNHLLHAHEITFRSSRWATGQIRTALKMSPSSSSLYNVCVFFVGKTGEVELLKLSHSTQTKRHPKHRAQYSVRLQNEEPRRNELMFKNVYKYIKQFANIRICIYYPAER